MNQSHKQNHMQLPSVIRLLQDKTPKDEQSLFTKISNIFFSRYNYEERTVINDLLQQWKEFDLQTMLQNDEAIASDKFAFYKDVQILSARVYSKVINYIKSLRTAAYSPQTKQIKLFLHQRQFVYSYNRYFWKRRTFNSGGYSYNKFQPNDKQQRKSCPEINIYSQWIQQSQMEVLKKLNKFMINIQLLTLNEQEEVHNSFIAKIQRISRQDQKLLYLKNMQLEYWEDLIVLHQGKFKSKQHEQQINKELRKALPNYYFYKNNSEGVRNISTLHEKFKDYTYLQKRQDYIQWMFPNHYGSAFNTAFYPLNYVEKYLFINDLQIGINLLTSVYIFFDFIGVELNLNNFQLTMTDQKRLENAFLVSTNNHYHLRVLACLSLVGFRKIALNLIDFLDKYTSAGQFLNKERALFQSSWLVYGQEKNGPRIQARNICFLQGGNFPKQHWALIRVHEMGKGAKNNNLIFQVEKQKSKIKNDSNDKAVEEQNTNLLKQNNKNETKQYKDNEVAQKADNNPKQEIKTLQDL